VLSGLFKVTENLASLGVDSCVVALAQNDSVKVSAEDVPYFKCCRFCASMG
jgi:hypothetical protein